MGTLQIGNWIDLSDRQINDRTLLYRERRPMVDDLFADNAYWGWDISGYDYDWLEFEFRDLKITGGTSSTVNVIIMQYATDGVPTWVGGADYEYIRQEVGGGGAADVDVPTDANVNMNDATLANATNVHMRLTIADHKPLSLRPARFWWHVTGLKASPTAHFGSGSFRNPAALSHISFTNVDLEAGAVAIYGRNI